MKNLYIVRTPLQLFNAFEAKERFSTQHIENDLLIIFGNFNDLKIMNKMLINLKGWNSVTYHKFFGFGKFFYAFKLDQKFKEGNYKNIFTGMIHHIPLHLMNKLNASSNWLLDDGNETRLIAQSLENGFYYKKDKSKTLLRINQNPEILRKLKLFTLYENLETTHEVVINSYSMFRTKVTNLEVKSDTCLIVGSNLVGTYIKSKKDYLHILQQIFKQTKESNKYYAPHRYLDDATKKDIEKLGFNVLNYETILEIEQLNQGWRYEHYYSIRSTAIDTLTLLYGVDSHFIRVPKKYFLSREKWEECKNIWDKSKNVLDLEEN